MVLCTYLGEQFPVRGTVNVEMGYQDQKLCLPLIVVKREGSSLLVQDRLKLLKCSWADISHVYTLDVEAHFEKHSKAVQEGS